MKGDLHQDSEGRYYREGDLTRGALINLAKQTKKLSFPAKIRIYFKFTCEKCGARCAFQDESTLYETGECASCGYISPVRTGGMRVEFNLGESVSEPDSPRRQEG